MGDDVEVLAGGVANAGAVVRIGNEVRRPASPRSELVFSFLAYLRAAGFTAAPEPLGFDAQGRERLGFIPGDVGLPPFPGWVLDPQLLASAARLLRRFHEAAAGFMPPEALVHRCGGWNTELAWPGGGPVVGHNDVCVENVVVRSGQAVALLDFEFAAPTHPLHDLAVLARHWVPLDTAADAARLGRSGFDVPSRLRLAADAYGVPFGDEREELVSIIVAGVHRGGRFIKARMARGEQPFIDLWEKLGGQAHVDRRIAWIDGLRTELERALNRR
ncbi:Phosphotransferase enzyme family protein [Arthrobacter saudimassiliensis]|uniref:Phosphotransferase enzyme family protein n=1 Tax=Arthrobacter saudimassiliensis TaxID=1461584 RepID=A0A078MLY5_9MICC|nr:Phosphotransferase enzyme family protein [Arthrobacter saudimassiliensis]